MKKKGPSRRECNRRQNQSSAQWERDNPEAVARRERMRQQLQQQSQERHR